MSISTLNLNPELYAYLQKYSVRENFFLASLREATAKTPAAHMMTAPEQVQFIALLLKLMGAKRVLEIGTFTGYATLAMAQVLPEEGEVVTCDLDNRWCDISHAHWQQAGMMGKIEQRLGLAINTMQHLLEENKQNYFDFIFIDADKENYLQYYELGLQLLRESGLMGIDNVLWGGAVANMQDQRPSTTMLRALNEKLYSDKRVCISMIPIGDGMTLICKEPVGAF